MEPIVKNAIVGAFIASAMAFSGLKRRSLSFSGSIAAWLVGFLSILCGLRGYLVLIFYLLGSKATKFKKDIKEKIDGNAIVSSQRGSHQVLACSMIAVLCALVHLVYFGEERAIDFKAAFQESRLACALVAHYSVCLGDTFASELGILSKSAPFLISVPWRNVPPGTNGGVTIMGTLWSGLGGLFIGISCIGLDLFSGFHVQYNAMIVYASLCGLLGSFVDSFLGATLQVSYYDDDRKLIYNNKNDAPAGSKRVSGRDILSNAQVNLVSVLIMTYCASSYLAPRLFS